MNKSDAGRHFAQVLACKSLVASPSVAFFKKSQCSLKQGVTRCTMSDLQASIT